MQDAEVTALTDRRARGPVALNGQDRQAAQLRRSRFGGGLAQSGEDVVAAGGEEAHNAFIGRSRQVHKIFSLRHL